MIRRLRHLALLALALLPLATFAADKTPFTPADLDRLAVLADPALSPDGRWLAYGSDESGSMEIYVRPFPETSSARWQVSTAGGTQPVWSKSGRQLYYLNGKNELVAADVRPGATFAVGEQRGLFSVDPFLRLGPIPSYDVSADDRRFVMLREGVSAQGSELVVAVHWLDGLKAKTAR